MNQKPIAALTALKVLIDKWIEVDKSHTLMLLSKLSHVPYSTVKRIYKGDGVPQMQNLTAILSEVATIDEMCDYLEAHDSKSQVYVEHLRKTKGEKDHVSDSVLRAYKHHAEVLVLTELASTNRGTTREEVQNLLGRSGVVYLDVLIDDGILAEKNGKIKLTASLSTLDLDLIYQRVKAFVNGYDRTQKYKLGVATEYLNREGINKVIEIMDKTHRELGKLMNKPEYAGDYPLNVSLACGLLDLPIPYEKFSTNGEKT